MRIDSYPSFAQAYEAVLRHLVERGERVPGVRDARSVGSKFGAGPRETIELRPFGYAVSTPQESLLASPVRRVNLPFIVGHWLWAMQGKDSVADIVRYNSRGAAFSDDGERFAAALGARLRTPVDQLAAAADTIRADANTRRAQLVVARPLDALADSRDISCPTSVQLFVREGALEMGVTMRSQSAYGVLPYDAAFFMWLHCWLADLLGIPCGPHTVVAWSFHLYVDELSQAEELLEHGQPQSVTLPHFGDAASAIDTVVGFETCIEHAVARADERALSTVARDAAALSGSERAQVGVLLTNAATRMALDHTAEMARKLLPSGWNSLLLGAASAV